MSTTKLYFRKSHLKIVLLTVYFVHRLQSAISFAAQKPPRLQRPRRRKPAQIKQKPPQTGSLDAGTPNSNREKKLNSRKKARLRRMRLKMLRVGHLWTAARGVVSARLASLFDCVEGQTVSPVLLLASYLCLFSADSIIVSMESWREICGEAGCSFTY